MLDVSRLVRHVLTRDDPYGISCQALYVFLFTLGYTWHVYFANMKISVIPIAKTVINPKHTSTPRTHRGCMSALLNS